MLLLRWGDISSSDSVERSSSASKDDECEWKDLLETWDSLEWRRGIDGGSGGGGSFLGAIIWYMLVVVDSWLVGQSGQPSALSGL